ncbi:hypothetical protein LPJ61_001989 [Coemansia biformis]|uniref:Uncharacterized protein n=1 Tax=Coemansia biformis TaxID=1286918 RepID=A0A9W7YDA5_9FUNG|nr:hypothetical protein LPJ61_001989 [Coemansia biformis]
MSAEPQVFACACLNVRVCAEDVAEQRTSLEDNADVLECTLDSSAIQVALNALVEVKPGSSIDPNISVVRCLLCMSAVGYFRGPGAVAMPPPLMSSKEPQQQQQQPRHHQQHQQAMPAPHTTVYLAKGTKDAKAIEASEKTAAYSEPFGIVLDPKLADKPWGQAHIPRELQQRASEYMRLKETEKSDRVRAFIREQDDELERLRMRTDEQCGIVARLIGQTHKEPAPAARNASEATSGLAVMLRRVGPGGSASGAGSVPNPFARGSPPSNRHSDDNGGGGLGSDDGSGSNDDDDDVVDAFLENGGGFAPGIGLARNKPLAGRWEPSQSGDESDLDAADENRFGRPAQTGPPGGNLSQMLMAAGSMPIQIPAYGSSSLTSDPFMSRREYHQRADEIQKNRRREQIMRGMPNTFVPPHKLMDSIHETDGDMLIGSKPRDAYPMSRHHAPG